MSFFDIDFGPEQDAITEERIGEMVHWAPRRMKLASDWPNALHEPKEEGGKWSVFLPFPETLRNAFAAMCSGVSHRFYVRDDNRLKIYLNDSEYNEESVELAKAWVQTVGGYVAIRDCLALSFAMDYRMEAGDPQKAKTAIGNLCRRAKPYQADASFDREAAHQLAQICIEFLQTMTCYESADCVVGMPPSMPDKPFDLPSYLAETIGVALGKQTLCKNLRTIKARKPLKGLPVEQKLTEIRGSVGIDSEAFQGKMVLLVDDLYQSGVSTNYVAMLLLQAGAKKVFGLACEKTLRNDDNLGSRGGP